MKQYSCRMMMCGAMAIAMAAGGAAVALADRTIAYPMVMDTGAIDSDDFVTMTEEGALPGAGIQGTDPRTGNEVVAELLAVSSDTGILSGVATIEKTDVSSGAVSTATFPVRGRARWIGELNAVIDPTTGVITEMESEMIGRARIAGGAAGSAINLSMMGGYMEDEDGESAIALVSGVVRFDRTAAIRYNGLVQDWAPGIGVGSWSTADQVRLTPTSRVPAVFRGAGVFSGETVLHTDAQTNIRIQAFPLVMDRPGQMNVALSSRQGRARVSAQHLYLAAREHLTEPGFDWAEPAVLGRFRAASPAGNAAGLVIRRSDDPIEDPILILEAAE